MKNLRKLGYDDFFSEEKENIESMGYSIARVIAEYKGSYKVKDTEGEYLAKITGKKAFNAKKREDYPAVGDWVAITKIDKEMANIHIVLPRKTILTKKHSRRQDNQIIATNIDVAFIVESIDRDYNLNRFERYLVLINEGNIKPVIILNKIDLISIKDLNQKIKEIKERFNNIHVISTSTVNKQGIEELMNYIEKNKTYCFVGSSGVGKSSLINNLLGKSKIKTKEISGSTGRGKHTTTNREMYFLQNGGIVIDNPGTRGVGITNIKTSVENIFDQIALLSNDCKYDNCTHTHESNCAVLSAVKRGEISKSRYLNYIKIRKESEHYEMNDVQKKDKDRKFEKFIKKSMKELNKNHEDR
ncbi:MAG: Putative ribosome biogenesis GTPase RsgA [Parcubacteria bacterium 32_520]|nr:MAG: Putative ribosome biogenesis GTPase RsgA [Parcubacteria bacterium 32_520]